VVAELGDRPGGGGLGDDVLGVLPVGEVLTEVRRRGVAADQRVVGKKPARRVPIVSPVASHL
jgi:hypothetical protein